MTLYEINVGDPVLIVAGEFADCYAVVDDMVGERSLWVFITEGKHQDRYVTVRKSSVMTA